MKCYIIKCNNIIYIYVLLKNADEINIYTLYIYIYYISEKEIHTSYVLIMCIHFYINVNIVTLLQVCIQEKQNNNK